MTAVSAPRTATPIVADQPPPRMRWVLRSLAGAVLVALALLALAAVPALRPGAWPWVALGLLALSLGCAAPVLRAAARRLPTPGHRQLEPEALTGATVVAASAWSVLAGVVGERPWAVPVGAVVVALALAERLVADAGAGVRGGRGLMPRWTPPAVLGVALLALAGWLVVDGPGPTAYGAGLAVLIAGAPGAAGVATPAALALGSRRGERVGVRLRDARAITAAPQVDLIVLDGLQTVADGRHVTAVEALHPRYLRDLTWFAGALEHTSDHPIGRAIAKLSMRGNVTGVEHLPGLGIAGWVDRHPVRVGKPAWVGLDVRDDPPTTDEPGQAVGVEVDARALGTITVADKVRDSAPAALAQLTALGLETTLVTEDSARRTGEVAGQVGIERTVPEAAPEHAVELVREARGRGCHVVLLTTAPGPAAEADLLLTPTSDAGRADVALDVPDLASATHAIGLARTIGSMQRASLRVALVWHATTMLLAGLGLLPPVGATAAAAGGMLLVVLLALGGRRPRPVAAAEGAQAGHEA